MNSMPRSYKTFGARGYTCQIDRIDKGFKELGCIESEFPDFIYCNDSGYYKDAIEYKIKSPNSKLILNVLDLPFWCANFDIHKIYDKLLKADIITTISAFNQGQIKNALNLDSYVIYNPSKNINSIQRDSGIKKYPQYKYLAVGRLRDKTKRANLIIESLVATNELNKLAVVGSEDIGYGHYLGVVSDEELNNLYNSVDYVFMTSNFEGQGLPANEAVLGGAIPLICSDLSTFQDFYPNHWGIFPNSLCIANRIYIIDNNPELKSEILKEVKQQQKIIYSKVNYLEIANRIINLI